MDQVEIPFSLRCPDHRANIIGMLNVSPNAKKIGYCYECIAENGGDATTLKTIPGYLKDKSNFYEKCRQRAHNAGDPPAEYVEELSKKGERLEKFSQYIDQEKDKIKRSFEEIRRIANQIIHQKEKECLELLDKEISGLSEAYTKYEKLLTMGWPKPSDIQNVYPEADILVQKMSQIESMDQLRVFMAGVHEDAQIQDLYFMKEDSVSRIKKKMDDLVRNFDLPEGSLPKIQSQILNLENLENLMKDLMKGLSQQEVQVENSIVSRMKAPTYESKIIGDTQFETIRGWLPKDYKFDLKLLFRGSADGMSSLMFHQKCDNKGATITLIKCRFGGANSSNTIGGFIDQSWHSSVNYSNSKEAFIFSLAEQNHNSVKCPIFESQIQFAFHGGSEHGPVFGSGNDIYIDSALKNGFVNPKSYSNAIVLRSGHESGFIVEEVEVFQVQ